MIADRRTDVGRQVSGGSAVGDLSYPLWQHTGSDGGREYMVWARKRVVQETLDLGVGEQVRAGTQKHSPSQTGPCCGRADVGEQVWGHAGRFGRVWAGRWFPG